MELLVHGHNVEITPELRSHLERQLESSLGSLEMLVARVTVRLHAPAGTEDAVTTCHILLELRPSGAVGIGESALKPQTAVDRAAERARQELARRRGRTTSLACPLD
jgi:ribosome-associated translation inhibitor RaiA